MDKLNETYNPTELVNKIKKESEERALKEQQEKERIKQETMHEFNDADSSGFWDLCFEKIPLKTIQILLSNMRDLETDEYIIRNKPAFFINLLKKQGLFPFKLSALLIFIQLLLSCLS